MDGQLAYQYMKGHQNVKSIFKYNDSESMLIKISTMIS